MQYISAKLSHIKRESIYSNIMDQYDLPINRSIIVEDRNTPPNLSNRSPMDDRRLFARKIANHIEFMEAEFMHNMKWQKKLLNHLLMLDSSSAKYKQLGFKQESEKTSTLKLNPNQQQTLREVLGAVLGQLHPELSIQELITQAAAQLKQKKSSSQKYTICSNKEDLAQPLELVGKQLTQNEFTSTRQIQHNCSPKGLPPRSPKQKIESNQEIVKKQQPFLTPNDYNLQWQSREVKLEYDEYLAKRLKDIDSFQESLSKRLFRDDYHPLVYIKDISDEQNLPDSQISLNLSQSNHGQKKYQDQQLFYITLQSPNSTQRPEKAVCKDEESSIQEMNTHQRENHLNIAHLCFAGSPKRKIGKGATRNQKKFDYGKTCSGKVKEMRDTFGKAYQEYYYQSSFVDGVEEFYRWKRALMQKSQESRSDWYSIH